MKKIILAILLLHISGICRAAKPLKPIESWQAKWIVPAVVEDDYNLWFLARNVFEVEGNPRGGQIAITADTSYELYLNGTKVSTGPVRAFPEHYRYDLLDVTDYLKPGRNVIGVRVHHWGRDAANKIAVDPGLLVQLEWSDKAGRQALISDDSWSIITDPSMNSGSPTISSHMGFEEQYDAGKELTGWNSDPDCRTGNWTAARIYSTVAQGPWKNLQPLEIPRLIQERVTPIRVLESTIVQEPQVLSTMNLGRCQGIVRKEFNVNHYRFLLVSNLESASAQTATVLRPTIGIASGTIHINGQEIDLAKELVDKGQIEVSLKKGSNPVIVVLDGRAENEEYQFALNADDPVELRNLFGEGEWMLAGPFEKSDPAWRKVRGIRDLPGIKKHRGILRELEAREIVAVDVHGLTCHRRVESPVNIENLDSIFYGNTPVTLAPDKDGSIELMIDLGKEYNTHVGFDIDAPAGAVVDGIIFERIHEGTPQWSWKARSSFRYTAREGRQSYVTRNHFGGRYVNLTFRSDGRPIRIGNVHGMFVHYPVEDRGAFVSSDMQLNKVWEICRQTMLSCMEDTFVDCPLYEQSLWLGDARNEALVCSMMFGDSELVRRCCILGCESVERFGMAIMRVPERWGRIIPAWNFLWARMCWENYWYSGDQDVLEQRYYPAVRDMLENCLSQYIDPETGLFSIEAWQFIDWTKLDNRHKRVTHNNTFLVDTLRMGADMAELANDAESAVRFRAAADELVEKINEHLWDEQRGAYVDSYHDDGARSTNVSRQINTLALLHNVVPPERRERVLPIVLGEQTENVVQFGSPFATLYLLEFLGETGRVEPMLDTIRELWGGMMDEQTTTFWESFATGNLGGSRYPTRSYCHAWSAGPAYTFSRYVLGVRLDKPAGRAVTITPRLDVLEKVEGIVPLPDGQIALSWERSNTEDVRLIINILGPEKATLILPAGWKTADHRSELQLKSGQQILKVKKVM